ncbi:MAG: hypothetical protein ACI3ZT_01750 [Candidatus Cryptobacteroides sp.]
MIDSIIVTPIGRDYPTLLPVVPSTASVEITDESGTDGRLRTVSLSGVLRHRLPEIDRELIVDVIYCDGCRETHGSEDLPVRFDVSDASGQIKISAKHKTALF